MAQWQPDSKGFHGALRAALTGRSSMSGQSLRDKLLLIGGASKRTKTGVDHARAAKKLGVSPTTVRRWLTAEGGQRPSGANRRKIGRSAQRAGRTKAGRAAMLAAQRSQNKRKIVDIQAFQGPMRGNTEYHRVRSTQLVLDPEDVEAMLDAYENGGESGFKSWASQHWGQDYLEDWSFSDWYGVEVRDL